MEFVGWVIALLLVGYIKIAPIDECSKCHHCRSLRIESKAKQKQMQNDLAHRMGIIDPEACRCTICKNRKG